MTGNLAGAVFMTLSMVGFAVEDALFKAATASVPAGLATVLFGITGLALFLAAAGVAGELRPVAWGLWLTARTVFEIAGRLFFALALAYAPLAETSAILQAAPLVVTLGAVLFLGERVPSAHWVAMGIGFLGVVLILRPGGALFDPALIFAVLGMVGFAGRDLATRAVPLAIGVLPLGVLGFAVVTVAGLILWVFEGLPLMMPGARGLFLLAAGAVGVFAYAAITRAMRLGEVGVVAPFRYARLVVALVIAGVVFGERPDAVTYLGSLLIVGTGLYTLVISGKGGRA